MKTLTCCIICVVVTAACTATTIAMLNFSELCVTTNKAVQQMMNGVEYRPEEAK